MADGRHVFGRLVVDGTERRYEIAPHESDLFAVTLLEGGQHAGPTDYLRSYEAAEQLGEQWLNSYGPRPE